MAFEAFQNIQIDSLFFPHLNKHLLFDLDIHLCLLMVRVSLIGSPRAKKAPLRIRRKQPDYLQEWIRMRFMKFAGPKWMIF
jgi:hypothetical protein